MDGNCIDKICKTDKLIRSLYAGVYSRDQIPSILEKNKLYILNESDSSDMIGTHWILISTARVKKNGEGILDFICSLGTKETKYKTLYDTMKKLCDKIYHLPHKIQVDWSSSCGSFVIIYCYLISRFFSPPQILKNFFPYTGDDTYLNDIIVCNLSHSLFGLSKPDTLLLDFDFLKERQNYDKKQKKWQSPQR